MSVENRYFKVRFKNKNWQSWFTGIDNEHITYSKDIEGGQVFQCRYIAEVAVVSAIEVIEKLLKDRGSYYESGDIPALDKTKYRVVEFLTKEICEFSLAEKVNKD